MKFSVAILSFVAAGFLWSANAITLKSIERYWTASPSNSYIFTPNQSEFAQTIEFKKEITEDHPLLLYPEIRSSDGTTVWSGNGLSICDTHDKSTYEYLATRMFTRALIPGLKNTKCPVDKQLHDIYRWQLNLKSGINDLSYGKYDIDYRVESDDGEVVFSKLVFRFEYEDPNGSWGSSGWGKRR